MKQFYQATVFIIAIIFASCNHGMIDNIRNQPAAPNTNLSAPDREVTVSTKLEVFDLKTESFNTSDYNPASSSKSVFSNTEFDNLILTARFDQNNIPTFSLSAGMYSSSENTAEFIANGTPTASQGFTINEVTYYQYRGVNPLYAATGSYNTNLKYTEHGSPKLSRFYFYRMTGKGGGVLKYDRYLIAIDTYSKYIFAYAQPTSFTTLGVPTDWQALDGTPAKEDTAACFYEYDPVGYVEKTDNNTYSIILYKWFSDAAGRQDYTPRQSDRTKPSATYTPNGAGRSPFYLSNDQLFLLTLQNIQNRNFLTRDGSILYTYSISEDGKTITRTAQKYQSTEVIPEQKYTFQNAQSADKAVFSLKDQSGKTVSYTFEITDSNTITVIAPDDTKLHTASNNFSDPGPDFLLRIPDKSYQSVELKTIYTFSHDGKTLTDEQHNTIYTYVKQYTPTIALYKTETGKYYGIRASKNDTELYWTNEITTVPQTLSEKDVSQNHCEQYFKPAQSFCLNVAGKIFSRRQGTTLYAYEFQQDGKTVAKTETEWQSVKNTRATLTYNSESSPLKAVYSTETLILSDDLKTLTVNGHTYIYNYNDNGPAFEDRAAGKIYKSQTIIGRYYQFSDDGKTLTELRGTLQYSVYTMSQSATDRAVYKKEELKDGDNGAYFGLRLDSGDSILYWSSGNGYSTAESVNMNTIETRPAQLTKIIQPSFSACVSGKMYGQRTGDTLYTYQFSKDGSSVTYTETVYGGVSPAPLVLALKDETIDSSARYDTVIFTKCDNDFTRISAGESTYIHNYSDSGVSFALRVRDKQYGYRDGLTLYIYTFSASGEAVTEKISVWNGDTIENTYQLSTQTGNTASYGDTQFVINDDDTILTCNGRKHRTDFTDTGPAFYLCTAGKIFQYTEESRSYIYFDDSGKKFTISDKTYTYYQTYGENNSTVIYKTDSGTYMPIRLQDAQTICTGKEVSDMAKIDFTSCTNVAKVIIQVNADFSENAAGKTFRYRDGLILYTVQFSSDGTIMTQRQQKWLGAEQENGRHTLTKQESKLKAVYGGSIPVELSDDLKILTVNGTQYIQNFSDPGPDFILRAAGKIYKERKQTNRYYTFSEDGTVLTDSKTKTTYTFVKQFQTNEAVYKENNAQYWGVKLAENDSILSWSGASLATPDETLVDTANSNISDIVYEITDSFSGNAANKIYSRRDGLNLYSYEFSSDGLSAVKTKTPWKQDKQTETVLTQTSEQSGTQAVYGGNTFILSEDLYTLTASGEEYTLNLEDPGPEFTQRIAGLTYRYDTDGGLLQFSQDGTKLYDVSQNKTYTYAGDKSDNSLAVYKTAAAAYWGFRLTAENGSPDIKLYRTPTSWASPETTPAQNANTAAATYYAQTFTERVPGLYYAARDGMELISFKFGTNGQTLVRTADTWLGSKQSQTLTFSKASNGFTALYGGKTISLSEDLQTLTADGNEYTLNYTDAGPDFTLRAAGNIYKQRNTNNTYYIFSDDGKTITDSKTKQIYTFIKQFETNEAVYKQNNAQYWGVKLTQNDSILSWSGASLATPDATLVDTANSSISDIVYQITDAFSENTANKIYSRRDGMNLYSYKFDSTGETVSHTVTVWQQTEKTTKQYDWEKEISSTQAVYGGVTFSLTEDLKVLSDGTHEYTLNFVDPGPDFYVQTAGKIFQWTSGQYIIFSEDGKTLHDQKTGYRYVYSSQDTTDGTYQHKQAKYKGFGIPIDPIYYYPFRLTDNNTRLQKGTGISTESMTDYGTCGDNGIANLVTPASNSFAPLTRNGTFGRRDGLTLYTYTFSNDGQTVEYSSIKWNGETQRGASLHLAAEISSSQALYGTEETSETELKNQKCGYTTFTLNGDTLTVNGQTYTRGYQSDPLFHYRTAGKTYRFRDGLMLYSYQFDRNGTTVTFTQQEWNGSSSSQTASLTQGSETEISASYGAFTFTNLSRDDTQLIVNGHTYTTAEDSGPLFHHMTAGKTYAEYDGVYLYTYKFSADGTSLTRTRKEWRQTAETEVNIGSLAVAEETPNSAVYGSQNFTITDDGKTLTAADGKTYLLDYQDNGPLFLDRFTAGESVTFANTSGDTYNFTDGGKTLIMNGQTYTYVEQRTPNNRAVYTKKIALTPWYYGVELTNTDHTVQITNGGAKGTIDWNSLGWTAQRDLQLDQTFVENVRGQTYLIRDGLNLDMYTFTEEGGITVLSRAVYPDNTGTEISEEALYLYENISALKATWAYISDGTVSKPRTVELELQDNGRYLLMDGKKYTLLAYFSDPGVDFYYRVQNTVFQYDTDYDKAYLYFSADGKTLTDIHDMNVYQYQSSNETDKARAEYKNQNGKSYTLILSEDGTKLTWDLISKYQSTRTGSFTDSIDSKTWYYRDYSEYLNTGTSAVDSSYRSTGKSKALDTFTSRGYIIEHRKSQYGTPGESVQASYQFVSADGPIAHYTGNGGAITVAVTTDGLTISHADGTAYECTAQDYGPIFVDRVAGATFTNGDISYTFAPDGLSFNLTYKDGLILYENCSYTFARFDTENKTHSEAVFYRNKDILFKGYYRVKLSDSGTVKDAKITSSLTATTIATGGIGTIQGREATRQ